MRTARRSLLPAVLVAFVALTRIATPAEPDLQTIKLPAGFHIEVFASGIANARSMALSPKGVLFVGSRTAGNVYAIDVRDGKAGRVYTIAKGLNMPNGVAFRNGALYVAEVSRMTRYDGIESQLDRPPTPIVIKQDLPTETHHGWKYLRFGPDGLLYFQIGAPCNVCDRGDPYASIVRMKPDGSAFEIYARGVRNSVGMDWQPGTNVLWFTDNGRDLLGDDVPPDELNRAPKAGLHFGFPYCHGGDVPDPEFGKRLCSEFTPPAQKLGAHVAAIGMRFYTGSMFPGEYKNQIFIAQHGSWNRSAKVGYRVMLVKVQGDRAVGYEPFAEGWLQGQRAWGRPADVLQMPDGALLVSDDEAGAIYRISYRR